MAGAASLVPDLEIGGLHKKADGLPNRLINESDGTARSLAS